MSTVSIVKTNGDSQQAVEEAVRQAVAMVGGLAALVKRGDVVLIKPNLVAVPAKRLSGAVTRWEVCKALADMVRELHAQPVIAESAAAGVDTEQVMRATGYDTLREQGYTVLDLKHSPKAVLPVQGSELLTQLNSFEPVARADVIISVPVMKTHDQTEVTLAMKNLKGLIDDEQKKEFHRIGVQQGVVDIVRTLKPQLVVVDGTVAQEGFGPIFGDPVEMGLILASTDFVSADAVAGSLMGYEPEEVGITKLAAESGLGEMNLDAIDVLGCSPQKVRRRFRRASEVEIPGLPPYKLVFTKGACTGCKNTVLSSLMDLKNAHLEETLRGKTIIAGPLDELPAGVRRENLVLVGKCTRTFKEDGTFVPGCPPNNIFVVRAIAGSENVERRYATEEGTDGE